MSQLSMFPRRSEAGVTLTEILVVLAIISITAGTAMMRLGSAQRDQKDSTTTMLAERLTTAATTALFDGSANSFEWQPDRFRFSDDQTWTLLPKGTLLEGYGRHVISADGLAEPFSLRLQETDRDVIVQFDGLNALLENTKAYK